MSEFNVGVCKDNEVIKEIFKEYSQSVSSSLRSQE